MRHLPALAALVAALGFAWLARAASPAAPSSAVVYPEGFRRWTHVTSGLIGPGNPAFEHFGGLHAIYANAAAVEGYRKGAFADGSTLVFDVHEAVTAHDATGPGKRRLIDVMVKDKARFPATDGWGFAEFPGDARGDQAQQPAPACHACHAAARRRDLVFTRLDD